MRMRLFVSFVLCLAMAIGCAPDAKTRATADGGGSGNSEKVPPMATKSAVEADSVGYIVKLGDIAPDFTCKLTDGKEVTLSALRGKVVMLQFTASWCGICREEMPHIESEIWQRHKENPDFILVGVDREETKEVVEAYTAKIGTTYPMLLDDKGDVFASYAVRKSGITRNVLIDRDGRIVMLTRRYVEPEFNQLVATIDSLLAK